MRNLPLLIATLPMPPSVNEMYMTIRGKRVLSAKARKYKEDVIEALFKGSIENPYHIHYIDALGARAIREACDTAKFKRKSPPAYRFRIKYNFIFETERRDIDNGIKPLQDCIMEWLGSNDRTVNNMSVERFIDRERTARVEVVLWEYPFQYSRPGELITLALQEFQNCFEYTVPDDEQVI